MTDLSGQVVKNYHIYEQLNAGGFGAVYRAKQRIIEREVAIKVILPQHANQPEFVRRFESEAQLVARLEHPHIVPLFDYWRDPEGAFLVMRWLRGGNLRDRMGGERISPRDAVLIVEQIAGALSVAHRNNVVHRDLKPENILMDEDGNAYLTDFGIAAQSGDEETKHDDDKISGTINYIAPEQFKSEPATPQSDIYSFGVVLYEMLVGEHPFAGSNITETIYKHLKEPLPNLRNRGPRLNESINLVIQRATSKDRRDRYETVLEFAAAFSRAVGVDSAVIEEVETDKIVTLRESDNPYKGLRSFQEADAADFYGRENLVDTLIERLLGNADDTSFLGLVGPSGSGKSSVVRAGLIPRLRKMSGSWFVADMTPGDTPLENLHTALLSIAVNSPPNLLDRLQRDPDALNWAMTRILGDLDGNVLLFIDQFEEIFTQIETDERRRHFLQLIYNAVTADSKRVYVVVTIRADFFDRPLMYEGIGDLIQSRTQVVLPLSADEIERAIVKPAERIGLELDSDLVAAIVADVREEPGALPLMQYALLELYERRVGNHLVREAYEESGGVQGALARRAQEVYENLDSDLQPVARQIFLRLVTLGEGTEDTRRRAQREELLSINVDADAINTVLDRYGYFRLLTFDSESGTRKPTVEIAHEALINRWLTLREWLDDARNDIRLQRTLSTAAREWQQSGRDDGYLLRGGRLIQFEDWAETTTVSLTGAEREFLEASIAERERQQALEEERRRREETLRRRGRRLLLALVGVFAIAGLVASGFAVFAFRQREIAEAERLDAQNARATSDANAANARQQLTIAERRAAEIQNLNYLNRAEQALNDGDGGAAMALALEVATSDAVSPQVQNALYDVAYASFLRERLTEHTRKITAIALSPDGQLLATGSEDLQTIIWDAATGSPLQRLEGHRGPINSLTFSPDGQSLVSAATDGLLIRWDVNTGEELQRYQGHTNVVTDVVYDVGGRQLFSSSSDNSIIMWDVDTAEIMRRYDGHSDSVRSIALSPFGQLLASAGRDGRVILWSVNSAAIVHDLTGHTGSVESLAFSADGQTVLSGSADETLILWNVGSGSEIRSYEGHADAVTSVDYSPDGQLAVSAACGSRASNRSCLRGEVIVWDVDTGRERHRLVGHDDAVNKVRFDPAGQRIYTASCAERRRAACIRGEVFVWDAMAAGDEIQSLTGHGSSVLSIALNDAGDRALSGGGSQLGSDQPRGDTSIIVWNMETGGEIQRLRGHTADVNSVIFAEDATRAVSASRDRTVRIWDIASGEEVRRFEGHTGSVHTVRLSPDGSQVLSAGDNRTLLWGYASGEEQLVLDELGNQITVLAVAFAADGSRFATALNNGTIIVYDRDGTERQRLIGHTDDVLSIDFNADGTQIASGASDNTLRLWNVASGEEIARFTGHESAVTGVQFHPLRQALLSSSGDGTLIYWDIATGEQIRQLRGHTDQVLAMTFDTTGETALSASADGTVRQWRVSLDALIGWVQNNRYVRELSEDELQSATFGAAATASPDN